MEVNFKELKRKDLQRLCKKHGLRANTTNAQMADSLVSLFKIRENNKQGAVLSKGFGRNRSSKVEGVEWDAEKVVIVVDEDDDKLGSVLQTADSKSSPKSRIEPRLDGSGGCGESQATRGKWHEENSNILLDEEDDEPYPVLRSVVKKKCRRLNRKAGKACEPSISNEANQPIGVLRNTKEGILVPIRTTRSRSMNSKVAHSPVVEKTKAREDRQGTQNVEPPLNTGEVEGSEVVTMKENPSVMIAAGDVRFKRKRKSRNSSMKVNDEIMIHLPIEVSGSENLAGDVINEKQVNNVIGSDITFSIAGKQSRQCTSTQNEQDIEEHELCSAGRLNRKAGKACEPSISNEAHQPIGVLRNTKEGILVPVRTTRSKSMNSKVAHFPVVEKTKARKDRQGTQNVEPPLNTGEVEGSEVVTMKENPSVMMAAGDVRFKRKRKSRNSSMKVNDEIMIHLPIEVSGSENLAGDVINEKQVNNVIGSDITFSIDGKQSRQCTSTRNEQDIEDHELCAASNLMEVVPESFGTQRRKKRTRAGLEEDIPIIEREIDTLGFSHDPDLLHRDEIVEPEVCFGSSQILGSPSLSNLASSRPCLLFSELQGGQDEILKKTNLKNSYHHHYH